MLERKGCNVVRGTVFIVLKACNARSSRPLRISLWVGYLALVSCFIVNAN